MLPSVSKALFKSEKKLCSTLSYSLLYTIRHDHKEQIGDFNDSTAELMWGFSFSTARLVHTFSSINMPPGHLRKCSSLSGMPLDIRKWHHRPSLEFLDPLPQTPLWWNLGGGTAQWDKLCHTHTLMWVFSWMHRVWCPVASPGLTCAASCFSGPHLGR